MEVATVVRRPLVPRPSSAPRPESAARRAQPLCEFPTPRTGSAASKAPSEVDKFLEAAKELSMVGGGEREMVPRSQQTAPDMALAHRVSVPGGLAGILLTALGSFVPGAPVEHRILQAAIMTVAPRPFLSSCKQQGCCWRWAAETLLDEYASLRAEANAVRSMLVDELGKSVRQELLNLRETHQQVAAKLETALKELDSLKKSKEVVDAKLSKAEHSLEVTLAENEKLQAIKEQLEVEAKLHEEKSTEQIKRMRTQLDEYRNADKALAEMKAQVEESDLRVKDANARCDDAVGELMMIRREKNELQGKVDAWENLLLKRKKKVKTKMPTAVMPRSESGERNMASASGKSSDEGTGPRRRRSSLKGLKK